VSESTDWMERFMYLWKNTFQCELGAQLSLTGRSRRNATKVCAKQLNPKPMFYWRWISLLRRKIN